MNLTQGIEKLFQKFLPSPFTLAVLLTLLTMALALIFMDTPADGSRVEAVLRYWEQGIWNEGLLVFAYQMMLILVLGHILVLSKPVERLIMDITRWTSTTSNAALLVAASTMLVAFFNWGLGLIFGALLARKVGEHAQARGISLNYPLIGACGYTGLMVWHGGISGSAPLKVAEEGHLKELMGSVSQSTVNALPMLIGTQDTVFSSSNLLLFATVLIAVAVLAYVLGRRTESRPVQLEIFKFKKESTNEAKGAERLDRSPLLTIAFGLLILAAFLVQYLPALRELNITPNVLNFFMLGLALILHGSFKKFLEAVEEAIGDVAGIVIQFPLYFGIMGIMSQSGMISQISDFFVSISTATTLPIFTFFSAGLVNVFVPSGGGQWAVQGPLVIESALQLGVPLPKAIMALAYGDQVTNMLQPFWALPLLAITKLKASDILPYTLLFMVTASVIYIIGLLLW
ncbi:short-chain fatty acid transporter [Croceiramulus getboli]|nr:TIGR00366 family protein [Flavobacteriaceae bacterium YJPT1-3]